MPDEWERLDVVAATPRRTVARSTLDAAGPRLRLRRSKSLVLSALDAGGTVLQQRSRDLLVGSALLLIPVVILNLWATAQVFDRTGATTLTAFGGDDVGTGVEDVAAVLAVVSAGLAAAVVGSLASIVLLGERFGAPVGLRPALGAVLRRFPTVLVAWAVGHVWVPFAATWGLASPSGAVASRLFVVMPIAACFATATLFVVPVIIGERVGPVAAITRSWRLVRLRLGSVFGFVCAATLVGALLLAGIAYLPTLAEAGGFITFGDHLWLAQGLSSQLGTIVVVPLIALATAQLYVLVRLDAEGLDLVLDAEVAFGPADGER